MFRCGAALISSLDFPMNYTDSCSLRYTWLRLLQWAHWSPSWLARKSTSGAATMFREVRHCPNTQLRANFVVRNLHKNHQIPEQFPQPLNIPLFFSHLATTCLTYLRGTVDEDTDASSYLESWINMIDHDWIHMNIFTLKPNVTFELFKPDRRSESCSFHRSFAMRNERQGLALALGFAPQDKYLNPKRRIKNGRICWVLSQRQTPLGHIFAGRLTAVRMPLTPCHGQNCHQQKQRTRLKATTK